MIGQSEMPTQRPLTGSVRRIAGRVTSRASTSRPTSHPPRTTQQASQNQARTAGVGGSARSGSRPRAFTEKQIAARREKEQQNLEKWQKHHKYWSEVKARLELFEHWDQKEQLRRTKSTGSHLNHLGVLDCSAFAQLGSLDRLNSLNHLNSLNQLNSLNHRNRLGSFNQSFSCLNRTEQLNWSSNQPPVGSGMANAKTQQLADQLTADHLCSELINELYILDPRKIPYDTDVELLRKPEAVDRLREKVKKQESKLRRLREECLTVRKRLKLKQRSRAGLSAHRKQLEQLYLEYSGSWLADWQARLARLELRCSDEELNLLFPARRGQIKGKDRLRLRNNLVSEHLNRCRQLLLQVRKLSGHYKVKNWTARNAAGPLGKQPADKRQSGDQPNDSRNPNGAVLHSNPGKRKSNLDDQENLHNPKEQQNLDGEMQSHLMQLLTDDERQVLANVLTTTIRMLDTFTTTIRRRANLYAALFE